MQIAIVLEPVVGQICLATILERAGNKAVTPNCNPVH